MVLLPSFLLAAAISIALHGVLQGIFGTVLGALFDMAVFFLVFRATKRFFKDLRDG